ncbi:unnamed protein product [Amaranthus hypochondriacus]
MKNSEVKPLQNESTQSFPIVTEQGNVHILPQNSVTKSESTHDFQLGFEENRYTSEEMRENPKKPKWVSCYVKQMGQSYFCKVCGKQFKSPRAVFGHLRCHSKRKQQVSLNETVKKPQIPRKKRSVGRYKIHTSSNNSSWSNLNAFTNVDDELDDIAASLLLLASSGAGVSSNCNHVSDDVLSPNHSVHSLVLRDGYDSFKDKNEELYGFDCGISNDQKFVSGLVSDEQFVSELYVTEIKNGIVRVLPENVKFSDLNPCACASYSMESENETNVVDQVIDKSESRTCDPTPITYGDNIEIGSTVKTEHKTDLCYTEIRDRRYEIVEVSDRGFGKCYSRTGKTTIDGSKRTINDPCLNEFQQYICKFCNMNFSTYEALEDFCLQCVPKIKKKTLRHECVVCSKLFPCSRALSEHTRAHFESKFQSSNEIENEQSSVIEEDRRQEKETCSNGIVIIPRDNIVPLLI